jgi:hypothetical protein
MKPYHLHGIAGLAERIQHPETGCTMSVYVAEQAGLDSDETWVAVCEMHSSMVGARTRAQALESAENPEWCEECGEQMQPNGKLVLRDPVFDQTNTTALGRSRLRAMRGTDFESAIVSAGNFAKKQNATCYVYRGNSFGHTVFRFTNKKSDALSPINNTGPYVWEVTPDLQVTRHTTERDEHTPNHSSNPAVVEYRGFRIEKIEGAIQAGHPTSSILKHTRKIGTQYLIHLEDGGTKVVSTMRAAREYVDNYLGPELTPNHSAVYYVWLVDYRGVPLDTEGPYGPMSLDRAKPLARIGATEGEHDRVVSIGRNPEADSFEIVRRYRRGTGERIL